MIAELKLSHTIGGVSKLRSEQVKSLMEKWKIIAYMQNMFFASAYLRYVIASFSFQVNLCIVPFDVNSWIFSKKREKKCIRMIELPEKRRNVAKK